MDPSAPLCLLYDTLKQKIPIIDNKYIPNWYIQNTVTKLTPNYEKISTNDTPPAIFCDVNRYNILQIVKDTFNTQGFDEARNNTNPFEKIGRSIFINRAAIKLANIDSVHNITGEIFTFTNKTSEKLFTFCDIAGGPGGFTQYMQYRFPNSRGYGITLKSRTIDWSTKFIDTNKFNIFYGPDGTGNLYTNWNYFAQFVLSNENDGVDLITADGGFDVEENTNNSVVHKQEFLSSRLLLTQVAIGITCTKINGNFLVKVFDAVTNFSAHVLFLLAQCFNKILIFKPITSRPANSERYIVCIGRKIDIQQYIDIISNAANTYTDDVYINTLFQEQLPESFQQWLIQSNIILIDNQLIAAQNILLYLQGSNPDIPQYNIEKFLTIWNLPDTPPRKEDLLK